MILASFDLQVTLMLSIKFQVIGLLVQKKRKIDFQDGLHGNHLGFTIRTILAIFDQQVTPMLPTMVAIFDFQSERFYCLIYKST